MLTHKRRNKPGAGRKPNLIPTKAIRLPLPLVNKLLKMKETKDLTSIEVGEIFASRPSSRLKIPMYESRIQAGFPSPADNFSEGTLDLNEYLITHKAATFFVRVTGESMTGAGIFPGDMLIVDRSLTPIWGKVVIAVVNGEMTVKRLEKTKNKILLCSENDNFPDIHVSEEEDFSIWGVVTNVIHSLP